MFARKPTSNGLFPSLESPSDTSVNRSFATVPANTTLQDVGSDLFSAAIREDECVEYDERLLVGLHVDFLHKRA